jgi:anti-sigma factor RsiW
MENNKDHDHDHAKCRKLFMKLSEYVDQELDADEYNEIKKHVEECGCCNNCLATLKKTVALCRELENESIPKSLSLKLSEIAKNCAGRNK